ncbi:MAG: hypothetical protein N2645_06425 [Clostridia bacterium]|nr:hypothetical protein [Clostridia bacterium]
MKPMFFSKRKPCKLLPFIILLLFSVQFLLLSSFGFDSTHPHIQNSVVVIKTYIPNANFAMIHHDNKKISFKLPASGFLTFFEDRLFLTKSSKRFPLGKKYIFNFRQKIEKTLSDYFHGTKYKDNPSAI